MALGRRPPRSCGSQNGVVELTAGASFCARGVGEYGHIGGVCDGQFLRPKESPRQRRSFHLDRFRPYARYSARKYFQAGITLICPAVVSISWASSRVTTVPSLLVMLTASCSIKWKDYWPVLLPCQSIRQPRKRKNDCYSLAPFLKRSVKSED